MISRGGEWWGGWAIKRGLGVAEWGFVPDGSGPRVITRRKLVV